MTVAATLTVAAIAAFGWMVKLVLDLTKQQTDYRHDLRNEVQAALLTATDQITHRIDRLEDVIQGVLSDGRRGRGS